MNEGPQQPVPPANATTEPSRTSTEAPHSARHRLSSTMMMRYLTTLVFPFSPHLTKTQKASLFVASPPLALVAMSPTLRLYCEREAPYRLGGTWFLSHEHAWKTGPTGTALDETTLAKKSGDADQGDAKRNTNDDTDDDEDDAEDPAWAGSRTGAGLTMDALPPHLGSVRLFQYLENTPSSWIGFCTAVARGLRTDTDLVQAEIETADPVRARKQTRAEPTSTQHASYLYVVCTHPEGRLALSLWWAYGRLRHLEEDAAHRTPQRRVYTAAALVACADLTFFSRVEKKGTFVPPTVNDDEAAIAGTVPHLLAYIFLHGAVTLAVEEELQHQWSLAHPLPSPHTADIADVTTTELDGGDGASSLIEEAVMIEPLLADCTDSATETTAMMGASFSSSPASPVARKRFDPSTAFEVCTRLHVLHLRLEVAESARLSPAHHRTHAAPRSHVGPPSYDEGVWDVWDVCWLARLFPRLTQLRLDGPPPRDMIAGRGRRVGHYSATRSGVLGPAAHRRTMVERGPGIASDKPVGEGRPTATCDAAVATVRTMAGLRNFTHLKSLYLRNCGFHSLSLYAATTAPVERCDAVDCMLPCGRRSGAASPQPVIDCTLPATLVEISVVGNTALTELGLVTALVAPSTPSSPSAPLSAPPLGVASDVMASALDLRVLSFVTVPGLRHLDALTSRLDTSIVHLTHLELSKTSVDSEALRAASLHQYTPALRVLRLTGTPVDDVACLSHLERLEVLNLSNSSITVAGLRRVPFFPALRELYLMQCWSLLPIQSSVLEGQSVGDEEVGRASSVRPTQRATPTTIFMLDQTAVDPADTNAGATAAPSTFPSLVYLDLSNNPLLTDTHVFPPLSFFEARVQSVSAASEDITTQQARNRTSLESYARVHAPYPLFPALRRLSLMHTAISTLSVLPWMAPRLRALDVSYTNVTSHGLWASPLRHSVGDDAPATVQEVAPSPLRLTRLVLTGTPITSLGPLSPIRASASVNSPSLSLLAAGCAARVGFTWLPALIHLNLSGTDITPEGVAAGLIGARVRLRTLSLAGSAVVAPPITYAVNAVPATSTERRDRLPPNLAVPPAAPRDEVRPAPGLPFAVVARQPPNRSAQADAAAELHVALCAQPSLRVRWHPADPERALWTVLFEGAATLTCLDLSRTAVELEAFVIPRRLPTRVAMAVRAVWHDGVRHLTPQGNRPSAALFFDAHDRRDGVESQTVLPTASALLRLVSHGSAHDDPTRTTASPHLSDDRHVSAAASTAFLSTATSTSAHGAQQPPTPAPVESWHVLLWRLLLSGLLFEPRHPSLRLTQLSLSNTPCAQLLKDHVVASARVQATTLTVALAAFQPVTAAMISADELSAAGAFSDLWSTAYVTRSVWQRLETLSAKDIRGIDQLVQETIFGRQCTFP